ncbi:hypothetical protein L1887_58163 [Cichorium endivia]|nr:hypothetical protein L1887_58163 [Cichorium endivia]
MDTKKEVLHGRIRLNGTWGLVGKGGGAWLCDLFIGDDLRGLETVLELELLCLAHADGTLRLPDGVAVPSKRKTTLPPDLVPQIASHGEPISDVHKHRAVGGGVVPADERVEDAPTGAALVGLGVAAVEMPDVTLRVVRAGTIARLGGRVADETHISIELEIVDRTTGHARGDEQQEARGADEEDANGQHVARAEDEVADEKTHAKSDDGREWDRGGGKTERDTADEDDTFQTLTKRGDERDGEERERTAVHPELEVRTGRLGEQATQTSTRTRCLGILRHGGDNVDRLERVELLGGGGLGVCLIVAASIGSTTRRRGGRGSGVVRGDAAVDGGGLALLVAQTGWLDVAVVEGTLELALPLALAVTGAEDGERHGRDEEHGDEVEDTLPELLCLAVQIVDLRVEDGQEGGADSKGNKQTCQCTEQDLKGQSTYDFAKLSDDGTTLQVGLFALVVGERGLVAEVFGGLCVHDEVLEHTGEDADDEGGLESLPGGDEEDRRSEDLVSDGHV